MPETTVETPASGATPAPAADPKPAKFTLAGREYESEAVAAKSFRELSKTTLGFSPPEDKPLIGENGLYPDTAAAEAAWKKMRGIMAAGEAKPEAKPVENKDGLKIEAQAAETPKALNDFLKSVNLDGPTLGETWAKQGKLTDEQYAALATRYDREDVDTYFAGLSAQVQLKAQREQAARAEAIRAAGGETQHENLRKWWAEKGDPVKRDKFNAMIESDPSMYPAVIGLIAQEYAAQNGGSRNQPIIATVPGSKSIEPAKPGEWTELTRRASNGDEAAMRRLAELASL